MLRFALKSRPPSRWRGPKTPMTCCHWMVALVSRQMSLLFIVAVAESHFGPLNRTSSHRFRFNYVTSTAKSEGLPQPLHEFVDIMISNEKIITGVKETLGKAFKLWLDENRNEILRVVAASVAPPLKPETQKELPPTVEETRYLTMSQLARRWHLHVVTIRRLCRKGALPSLLMGRRHLLVPLSAVEEYEADATINAKPRR